MPPPLPVLPSRSAFAGPGVECLSRGGARNPDVLLVPCENGPVVVKDFAPRGPIVRALLARWINAREIRALRALAGHVAVPRYLGSIDELAFAVEHRPGRRMSRKLRGRVPADFLDRLEAAIADMHARGVAHLDLRHRSNVLVDEAGAPVLIDFASAVVFRPGGFWARVLMPWLARVDLGALQKWRERIADQPTGSSDPGSGSSGSGRGASRPT